MHPRPRASRCAKRILLTWLHSWLHSWLTPRCLSWTCLSASGRGHLSLWMHPKGCLASDEYGRTSGNISCVCTRNVRPERHMAAHFPTFTKNLVVCVRPWHGMTGFTYAQVWALHRRRLPVERDLQDGRYFDSRRFRWVSSAVRTTAPEATGAGGHRKPARPRTIRVSGRVRFRSPPARWCAPH